MSKRNVSILVVAMLLLTLVAIMLYFALHRAHENFDDNITVTENGITESILPVRDLALNPGVQKEYQVNLVCEASGGYYITLDYKESHDGGMKSFVNVKVVCEGIEGCVYDGPLTDLLDKDVIIEFEGDLRADDPLEIRFIYEMPITIGNEAQGTSSDFDICLKIKKN